MKRETVKWLIGLALAESGYRTLEAAATKIGITPSYLSIVLACKERPVRIQLALAKLTHRTPVELFGPFTHPNLRSESKKESA